MAPRITPMVLKPSLVGMAGLSQRLIDEHYNILYKGYVSKFNEIRAKLEVANLSSANQTFSEFRELKVEESFALNAVRLHEWYFENLGGSSRPDGLLSELLARDFGTPEAWQEEFKACGMVARGWTLLAYDLSDGKLHNYIADAHNLYGIWSALPVLVLDTYEHAYALDYGARRLPYLEAFLKNVAWDVAGARLQRALRLGGAES